MFTTSGFNTIGSISFDHPDPSIFTVLTSPSASRALRSATSSIFPDRWLVAENTFRPPWYHRNTMSEYMGLIYGAYDAKEEGFVPGAVRCTTKCPPTAPTSMRSKKPRTPTSSRKSYEGTMAFMFETRFPQRVTKYAAELPELQDNYVDCWLGLEKRFTGQLLEDRSNGHAELPNVGARS